MTPPDWAGTLAERGAGALLPTYARYPIEVASGRGCRLVDSAGREYLDLVAGIAVNALGHAHPAIAEAIRSAAGGVLHVSNLYWTEPMVRLAERLASASGMEKAFFCNSGAEAVEAALKLARRARPGRPKLVAFERSFHGRTLGALSVTAQPKYQGPFAPLVPGVEVVPYGDAGAAAAAIDGSTSAVVVEVVQGEGGVRPAPSGFLAALRGACDAAGALLIVDEVQTGVGRTGTFYAYQGEGIVPDIVATAKGLGGGVAIGAILARGDAAAGFGPGDHGSTFGGNLLAAAVANAVLDVVLADGFLESVKRKGERLGAGLRAIVSRCPAAAAARGRGLMWGLVLDGVKAGDLVLRLHDRGVLTVPAGPDVLRLVPPLTISDAEIVDALSRIDAALEM